MLELSATRGPHACHGRALLWLLLCVVGLPVSAQSAYRWQDDTGQTVFSQHPPAGVSAVPVAAHPGTASPDHQALLAKDRQQFAPPPPAATPAPRPPPTPKELAQLAEACAQAQGALSLLLEYSRPHYVDAQGQRAYMSESMQAERIVDAQQKSAAYCR